MKNLLIALALSLPVFSLGARTSPLTELSEFYHELSSQEVDLVDHHFFIDFMSANAADKALRSSATCSASRAFKKTSTKNVVKLVRQDLTQAIEIVFDGTDGFFDWMTNMENVLTALEGEMNGKRITICTDESVPAYSDGHLVTYVKADGRVLFAFESGQPD